MSGEPRRKLISGYRIVRQVADRDREIYLADARKGEGHVVLVVVDGGSDMGAAVEHEVRRCMRLRHHAFARITDIADDGKRKVVAFEHVEGTSLHRLLRYVAEQDEHLGDGAVLHIGVALLEALNEAHGAKTDDGKLAPLVHGQLGPHQVLISWEGEVKVMGFGLGPLFAAARDHSPSWLVPFLAPEVRAGAAPTTAANVYAAGAMLWSLLSRQKLPEDGTRPESLRKMRPDLPPSVTFPLDRALEPEVEKRISARALQVGLTRAVEDADREELRWAMEVCRVRCTVEEEFLPQESLPSSSNPTHASRGPSSSLPPEYDSTGNFQRPSLLEKARLIGPLPWEKEAVEKAGNGHDLGATQALEPEPAGPVEAHAGDAQASEPAAPRRAARRSLRAAERRRSKRDSDPPDSQPVASRLDGSLRIPRPARALGAPPEDLATIPAPAPRVKAPAVHITAETARAAGESEAAPPSEAPQRSGPPPHSGVPHPSHPPLGYFPGSHYPHPGSYGPHPSQYPYPYEGAPPSGPVAMMPSMGVHPSFYAPGSMMAPPPQTPTKWIVAIAVTAVGSFVLGLLLASGGFEMRYRDPPPAAAAPAPPEATAARAEPSAAPSAASANSAANSAKSAAAPTPAPTAEPVAVPAPEPAAAPEPAPEAVPVAIPPPTDARPNVLVVRDSDAAAGLAAHRAHLIVHSAMANAHVYVHGRFAGPTGERLEVDCGMKFLRLGTAPPTEWLEPGQSLTIPCRAEGEISVQPRPQAFRPAPSQFLRRR